MDEMKNWRIWRAAALVAITIALGACGGGDEPSQAATDMTERPDDLAEVVEGGSYEECLGQATSTMEQSGELTELLGEDVNLTTAASPELIDEVTTVMAECLGTEGVAKVVVAEISFGTVSTPPETATFLTERISGDGYALLRSWFATIRQERIPDDIVAVTAEHYAACFPASAVVSGGQPTPLTAEEAACADQVFA